MSFGRTRRSLLPALAGLAVPLDTLAQSRTAWRAGLQLYTVRDALGTDLESTLRRVADVGYREVELAGLPGVTAHAMRASLQRYGLDAPSMHASYDRLRGDLRFRSRGGTHSWSELPGVPVGRCRAAHDRRRLEKGLPDAEQDRARRPRPWPRARLPQSRLRVRSVRRRHDAVPLLLTETDPRDVKLELDVYWVAKAGQDPLQYLKDGQDRIRLVHLKDLASRRLNGGSRRRRVGLRTDRPDGASQWCEASLRRARQLSRSAGKHRRQLPFPGTLAC